FAQLVRMQRPASLIRWPGRAVFQQDPIYPHPLGAIVTRSPPTAATCLISPHVPAGLGQEAKYPRSFASLKIGAAGGSANTTLSTETSRSPNKFLSARCRSR